MPDSGRAGDRCGFHDLRALPVPVGTGALDVVMMAGQYSLLAQTAAESFLPECVRRGVDVVAASVLGSGLPASSVQDERGRVGNPLESCPPTLRGWYSSSSPDRHATPRVRSLSCCASRRSFGRLCDDGDENQRCVRSDRWLNSQSMMVSLVYVGIQEPWLNSGVVPVGKVVKRCRLPDTAARSRASAA